MPPTFRVHITKKSSNAKTGPIPTTTTEQKSCPSTCPFINKGCYAKSGPQALHWRKVSNGERGGSWQELCQFVQDLPAKQLWRHNVAGDLPNDNGEILSNDLMELIEANKGRKGYTYTHHILNSWNIGQIQLANALGFTVNASTETLEAADHAMDHGIPAVAVIASDADGPEFTPGGRPCIVCPAQTGDTTCSVCHLCQKVDRKCVVLFKAHGTFRRAVNEIVAA